MIFHVIKQIYHGWEGYLQKITNLKTKFPLPITWEILLSLFCLLSL